MADEKQIFANAEDFYANLGDDTLTIVERVLKLDSDNIIDRIWKNDHTVWGKKQQEISNRLGWLHSPEAMTEVVPEIEKFVKDVLNAGFQQALLLGMGGSSLATEVCLHTFGVKGGYVDLQVLDSTDPDTILEKRKTLNLKNTLFIVATKSGGTIETISLMKYFFNLVLDAVGKEKAGDHFVAITDPGSGLEKTADKLAFRKIFLNDPNIGGRYSALSYFGLVPAALIGINISRLLERGRIMAVHSRESILPETAQNSAAWLGAILGEFANQGKDKLTLMSSPTLKYIGAWVEQLIAESTGKKGKGILPVVGEKPGTSDDYSNDRVFVYMKIKNDNHLEPLLKEFENAGHPVIRITLRDTYDLGQEFFRWEIATAVAGHVLGINPFDQPDVESAKIRAREMMALYEKNSHLPELPVALQEKGITVYGDTKENTLSVLINNYFDSLLTGNSYQQRKKYVAIQAYLNQTDTLEQLLQKLRAKIRNQYGVAVSIGYGPRFLHSTGQLHKGDSGRGLFLQLLADTNRDCPIPDEPESDKSSASFGILKSAQALGDRQALLDAKRNVLTLHLGSDVLSSMQLLVDAIK
jgi:glucose-6-phosphate isomerase